MMEQKINYIQENPYAGWPSRTGGKDKEVAKIWAALAAREQLVVALCCLEYSDHEIAATLDIAYSTARTHLNKAIDKLGINKKPSVGNRWLVLKFR
jgi:ATP/maltotriose-dependent transcriptional regulator MalT